MIKKCSNHRKFVKPRPKILVLKPYFPELIKQMGVLERKFERTNPKAVLVVNRLLKKAESLSRKIQAQSG